MKSLPATDENIPLHFTLHNLSANDSAFLVGPLCVSPAFAQLDGAFFTENADAVFWRLKIRFIIHIILQEANGSNELMDELSLKYDLTVCCISAYSQQSDEIL